MFKCKAEICSPIFEKLLKGLFPIKKNNIYKTPKLHVKSNIGISANAPNLNKYVEQRLRKYGSLHPDGFFSRVVIATKNT